MSNTARTNNNRAANNRATENQVKEKPAEESRAEGNRMEERAANTRSAVDTRPKVSSIDEDEEYIPPARELPARARNRAGAATRRWRCSATASS